MARKREKPADDDYAPAKIIIGGRDLEDLLSSAKPSARRGRRPLPDTDRIIIEMCWHLSGQGEWGKLQRDSGFIPKMRAWCTQESITVPSDGWFKSRYSSIRKRFEPNL
jgi:hypothetical protein